MSPRGSRLGGKSKGQLGSRPSPPTLAKPGRTAFLTNPIHVNLSKKTMTNANKMHFDFFWRSQGLVFHCDNGADAVDDSSLVDLRTRCCDW